MSPASDDLGRRVRAARETAFVGREEELAAFEAALCGACDVLYVHGLGGIGKTALLERFAHRAAAAGRPVSVVNLASPQAEPVLPDTVLLIDDLERVPGQERWLRERFLPRLPARALAVIAGRNPPGLRWRADPGWAEALNVLPLRDLRPEDAQTLVGSTGMPSGSREPLLTFAGGHPLALLMGASAALSDGGRWTPDQDLVATLLDHLVGELPSAAHRHALEICAHAYTTTEDLLRAALPQDAEPLFGWLRRLPFVESGSLGLSPHHVVRNLLEADLRWRDPGGGTRRCTTVFRRIWRKRYAGHKGLVMAPAIFVDTMGRLPAQREIVRPSSPPPSGLFPLGERSPVLCRLRTAVFMRHGAMAL